MSMEKYIASAAFFSGVASGTAGDAAVRIADGLNENTIIKGVHETAAETAKRLSDANWYEHWGHDLHVVAITLIGVGLATAFLAMRRKQA